MLTTFLFTEQPSCPPAEVQDMSAQASGISSAPGPKAVGGSVSKAKDHVLGEYLTHINF